MPTTNINGKTLFYTIAEPQTPKPNTPALLLIHGLGSSHSYYASIVPTLTSHGDKCISMDTYGSGLSKLQPRQSENSISTITADVIGLLDYLGEDKICIVGHSMGCIVASNVAAEHPDRVQKVVLIGPVHPSAKMAEVFEGRIATIQKANSLEPIANTTPTAATGKSATPLQRAFIRALILGTECDGYMSLCKVIANAEAPKYKSIAAALMIISGEEDQVAPRSGCDLILEQYGSESGAKKIEVLGGVGHWHCVEAPDRVAELIAGFA